MSVGIFLSYKGLGTNILHLSYCHEIAKVFGPVEIITLSNKFEEVVEDDPLIKKIIYLDKYYRKLTDIIKLSKILKKHNFEKIFIFYPSLRFYLAAKLAGIKNIFTYPLFRKKNLHLVKAAKNFIEKSLNIKDCPTETSLFINKEKNQTAKNYLSKNKKNIIIGAGSSGPTTKWGVNNYVKLIKMLQEKHQCYFLILSGVNEERIANEIVSAIGENDSMSIANKGVKEIVPIIANAQMYIGNDSFGQHVSCQSGKPSIILLLDTPSAYSDYNKNQHQVLPEGISKDNISHDSVFSPDKIKVNSVLNIALKYL